MGLFEDRQNLGDEWRGWRGGGGLCLNNYRQIPKCFIAPGIVLALSTADQTKNTCKTKKKQVEVQEEEEEEKEEKQ